MSRKDPSRSHSSGRDPKSAPDGFGESVRSNSPYLALGWQLAATIILFVAIGYGLDVWLDTRPWFIVTGAVFGIISFFALIYKLVRRLEAEDRQRKDRRNAEKR